MTTKHAPMHDRAVATVAARADNMLGCHAAGWSADQRLAWEGLMEVARVLRRDAEAHLEDTHAVSVSMLGAMGRLLRAPDSALRLTDLADAMGLSISRISRLIDTLEGQGCVRRTTCPTDARATHVVLEPEGRRRTEAAQETVERFARDAFIGRLDDDETATLARVFARLIGPHAAGSCEG